MILVWINAIDKAWPNLALNDALKAGRAVSCLNQAMKSAHTQAQLANKVFSPQNWCKSLSRGCAAP